MGVLTDYKPVATASVATSTTRTRQIEPRSRVRTFQCLLACGDPPRREMLLKSVNSAGWETVVCRDPAGAWSALRRELFQMAVVDLQSEQQSVDFRELCEQLASQQKLLLMVCGNEANAAEEIWARQLGAWLYLPGVSAGSDVETLCIEGRNIAQRIHRA